MARVSSKDGEDREGESSARVRVEALHGGPGEPVLSEGTPQRKSGRRVWECRDGAGKPLSVELTTLETLGT